MNQLYVVFTMASIAQRSQACLGNLTALGNLFCMRKPDCIQEKNLKQTSSVTDYV